MDAKSRLPEAFVARHLDLGLELCFLASLTVFVCGSADALWRMRCPYFRSISSVRCAFCLNTQCAAISGSVLAYLSPHALSSFPVTEAYQSVPEHGWCSLQIDRQGRRLFVFNANGLRVHDLTQPNCPGVATDTRRMRHAKRELRSCFWSETQRQLYVVAAEWVECFAEVDRVWHKQWRTSLWLTHILLMTVLGRSLSD